ncbi:uncharacterized protein LOC134680272 [Cydia fagiglandana]|uniref:uncharacterized protein LOC134680272 n=1 Tax=Cydia fagiglandana TaxID=1458189 RepID=UPI002FEDEB4B
MTETINVHHETETTGEEETDIVENSSTDQVFELNPGLLTRQRKSYELRDENPGPSYVFSPIHSNESDVDLSDTDPTYTDNSSRNHIAPRVIADSSSSSSKSKSSSSESSSSRSSDSGNSSSDSEHSSHSDTPKKRGRKKSRNPENWKQNKVQKLRNSGQPYTSMSASCKSFPGRSIKPFCTHNCKHKCSEQINEETRSALFNSFWQLADLYKQRAFISACMVDVQPKYRYTNAENPRSYNKAYYFTVENRRIRVCKLFFKNTLDITDRMIQTTKNKHDGNGFLQDDLRGRHENHKKISEELVNGIKEHISSIPHIESQYLKKTALREYYIDGSKTIVDLYKDFQDQQAERGKDPTTKFLQLRHTQNEADNVHSLIEKEIKRNRKSGPIYCPQQYIPIIKSAKKKDMELLQKEWGYNYNVNDEGESVVWNDIKVLKFTKEDPFVFYYKSSYNQEEYSKVSVRNKRKKMPSLINAMQHNAMN